MAETKEKATEDKRTAEARTKLNADRDKLYKDQEEQRASMRGTPTPTQEEADLIKTGHHPTLAEDGSTEPQWPAPVAAKDKKHATAEHGGANYNTRSQTASTTKQPA